MRGIGMRRLAGLIRYVADGKNGYDFESNRSLRESSRESEIVTV